MARRKVLALRKKLEEEKREALEAKLRAEQQMEVADDASQEPTFSAVDFDPRTPEYAELVKSEVQRFCDLVIYSGSLSLAS